MWKSLNPGEKVFVGDTIRYKSSSTNLSSVAGKIYQVLKVELHYFEIALKPDAETSKEPVHKIVRYMDVGYHVDMEKWVE